MDMLLWKKQPARKTLEELQGRPCFIGIDLAAKRDVAAMVLLFPPVEEDEPWHVHGRYYLPEDVIDENVSSNTSHYDAWAKEGYLTLTPGAVIDYEAIKDDIRDFSSQFIIKAIAYDRAYAWEFSPSLLAEGLPMVEIMATVLSFSEPMKRVEALVAEKLLAHGNCPMLTWMMSNVVAQMDKKENIYPRKEQPDNKIDGPVALIMAMNRALLEADTTSIYDKGARL
jgi:phage terminase large subunit-like protein